MTDGDQCPGCGRMTPPCACTPAEIRAQLVKDRAELSDRAASYTARANDAARLLRLSLTVDFSEDVELMAFEKEVKEWLEAHG